MNTIVLLNPKIPQNTGTIARLCVVSNTSLHLLGTLGFELSDKYLKRAGMDYWQHLRYQEYPEMDEYFTSLDYSQAYLFSTKATQSYHKAKYTSPATLIFGNESSGTPKHIQEQMEARGRVFRIPMRREHRSINLAVSTGIILYEVLRQQGYEDLV